MNVDQNAASLERLDGVRILVNGWRVSGNKIKTFMSKRKLKSAIPDESLAPLGKVVANFAVLESNLEFAIWLLLIGNSSAEQRTGQIVTAELMFKNKIALLSSLYQHRFPTKAPFSALKEMRKKLNDANNKRNDLIHSTCVAPHRQITQDWRFHPSRNPD